jgi:sigma-B regulation protein RsbU (phosphoserine phosphatase)
VSDRKIREHELMIMGKALENSLNAIAVSDIDGDVEYVNNAFYLMWGLEYREKVPGINVREILKSSNETTEIMQGLRDMECWLGEIELKNDRGLLFNVFLSSSIIKDDMGKAIGIVFTFVDITMRKKAEQKLKESEGRLTERNEAMERDLKLAQYAQSELIKVRVPESDLMNIGYRYKPLDKIGGDYFSFSVQREGSIGIFIGDVSGHGVASALFVSLLKSVSDRVLRKYRSKPFRYISMLNAELLGNMSSHYITGIYGIFEKNSKGNVRFTYSNGGHPSPVLVDTGGNVTLLKGKNMVIGVNENEKFQEQEEVIKTGDRMFFYTDGIPETMNEKSEMLGYEKRLIEIFEEGAEYGLEDHLDFIISRVDNFRGSAEVHDDMLLIGFEVM